MWRVIHYATFALFVGALGHGIFSGTDSQALVVQYQYLAAAVGVLFLTFFGRLRRGLLPAKSEPRATS